ncbi:MAG: peptidase domain-containing ABC transporter [Flavobacteriales bacterium]|nr:peptidase domain-containing ABC transporter [Flavobacteriales bacterium]
MNIKIKQHDIKDCGAACLASVSAHYKLGMPIARIRQYAATDKRGTNVLGMIKAAEKLGFTAKGVKGDESSLEHIPLPAIAHVIVGKKENELHHFVVIYKVKKDTIEVMDPGEGVLKKYTKSEFIDIWTGVLVLLEPRDDFKEENHKTSIASRFFQLLTPHKSVLFQALVGAVLYTLLGLSSSIYIEKITDYVLVGGNTKLLNTLSIGMIVILLVQIFIGSYKSILILRTGQLMDSKLILGYYKHLLKLPQRFFDTMQIGEITSRISDAIKIRAFINDVAINVIVNIFIVVFSFALMFTYYWKLAVIILLIIPFYLLVYLVMNKLNKKFERQLMEDAADLESQLVESLNSVKTIKQYDIEEFSNSKTENRFVKMLYTVYSTTINDIFGGVSTEFLSRVFTIVLMWVGSYYVIDNEITAGELMSFYALIGYFTGPMASLITTNKSMQSALIAADRLFEIMDLEREEVAEKIQLTSAMIGDIQFKNVNFSYGTRADIFEDFSIQFKKGHVSGIVGESGSGKSTLVNLLQNLYPINSGKISLGDYDIKYLSNSSVRDLVAAVPQQINLFSGNVIENIAVGEYEPDIKRIVELCKELGILEFIEKLPNGFESQLGENGALLSGGQKQRIAIARALYKNPEIIIFDEATSSLDTISEKFVQDTIFRLKNQGKTILIIAHRLSTVKNADQLYVIDKGKVVEQGTHQDLINNDGHYSGLWKVQTGG